MRIKSFAPKPFEDIYEEFYMEHAQKCGSGSFGKVYLIQCQKRGTTYAAKYQQLSSSDLKNHKRCARNEAEILSTLCNGVRTSACIPYLIGYYETKMHTLLVTEYLKGGELFHKITDKNYVLTEGKARGFVKQIVEGLNFIHSRNILHLDIKPQNVMLVDKGSDDIKLIDFGLARYMQNGGTYASMVGTIGFMAPEVLQCTLAGPGTDFFSLGVLTFMLLSGGHEPFWYTNEEKTIKRTLHHTVQYKKNMSEVAVSFLSELLEKKLENRISGQRCLAHPWLKDGESETVLETEYFKKYMTRIRWAKAIRAVRCAVRIQLAIGSGVGTSSSFGRKDSICRQKPEFVSSEIPIYL